MRELKFRVWNSRYSEFVRPDYGLIGFCYPLDGRISVLTTSGERMGDCILEQYTGLKDKNGKEIYEGDILQDVDGDTATVFWRSSQAEWGIRWTENKGEDSLSHRMFWDGLDDIIGNIHENPELLEGE